MALGLLLDSLMERNCLKKLSLSRVGLNSDQQVVKLAKVIETSRYLADLDVSWNGLRAKVMGPLLETLGENR